MFTFIKNLSTLAQVITLLILMSLIWIVDIYIAINEIVELQLKTQATAIVQNVESLGKMISGHGGIWVLSDSNYSGQYLEKVPAYDGTGNFFYKKNPALVQREFSDEIIKSNYTASYRMISSRPMNLNNLGSASELEALERMNSEIIQGKPVRPYVSDKDGSYNYIQPVFHSTGCIKCHGSAAAAPESVLKLYGSENGFGFKEGDLAGGISVKINYSKSSIILQTISTTKILMFLLPMLMFVYFIYKQSKYIKSIAQKINQYRPGQDVGINAKDIPDDTKNEIFQLIKGIASLWIRLQGAQIQIEQNIKAQAIKNDKNKP